MREDSSIEHGRKRRVLSAWLLALVLLIPSLAIAAGIDEPFKKPETAEAWSWGQLFGWATGRDEFLSGKSYALVIGVSDYANGITPLQYTGNDPIRMRDFLLNEAGFDHVHVLTEEKATRNRIRQLMEDELPALIGGNDRFLFYWSGHGIDFEDGSGRARGYLPLTTSGPGQRSSMVSMAELDAWDDFINARHALYLLDACASGLATYEVQGDDDFGQLDNATLERLSKPGRHLITAGTGGQKTIASARWKGSVFTDSILRAARGEADVGNAADPVDGVVSLPELLEYVTKRVDRERRAAEFETAITPKWEHLRDDNEGGFFFITPDKKTETAEAEGGQPTGELKDGKPVVEVQGEQIQPGGCDVETDRLLWDTIRNETEPAYFEEYLRRAEAGEICGRFVNIAKLKVEAAAGPAPEPSQVTVEQDPRRVKDVQELLAALGYDPGPADGVMGGRTYKALILFQEAAGMEPTGQLTVDVEIAIAKAHAELPEPDPQPAPGDNFKDCSDCPEMMVIPAGSFMMGSAEDEEGRSDDEGPQHRVSIGAPFALGKYEVTRGQFSQFVSATGYEAKGCYYWGGVSWENDASKSWRDPGFEQADDHPVTCVSWDDTQAYLDWLVKETGENSYRLPSEAEWEYAARAGTTTPFWTGTTISANQANYNGNFVYGDGQKGGYREGTAPIDYYSPNPFNLHDMTGNLWEWVEDQYHENYEGAPTDGRPWLAGNDSRRALRGGSWNIKPRYLRSAYRFRHEPDFRNYIIGFRVARTLTP